MKKCFLIFLGFYLITNFLLAQTPPPDPILFNDIDIAVVNSAGNIKYFSNLDSAINFAKTNDYIYIPGGIFYISSTITKTLNIIGAGFNSDSTKTTNKTVINNISIGAGADNLVLDGLWITTNISFNYKESLDNVVIRRCNVNSINFNGGHLAQFDNDSVKCKNTQIIHNVIRNTSDFGGALNPTIKGNIFNKGLNNLAFGGNIENNIFLYNGTNYLLTDIRNVTFKNNIFNSKYQLALPYNTCSDAPCGSYNNIFLNNVFIYDSAIVNLSSIADSLANNNFNVSITSLFVKSSNVYSDKDNYNIKPGSSLKNSGTDATDPGIFGSDNPFKVGDIPDNPHISFAKIVSDTLQDKQLHVNFKVIAQPNINTATPYLITEYRYWWSNLTNKIMTIKLNKPSEIFYLNREIKFSDIPKDVCTLKYQFKDTTGSWSLVYAFYLNPIADFVPLVQSDNNKFNFSFTNVSTFSTSYKWDFGDGSSSNLDNPVHEYTKAGEYMVKLIAYNPLGNNPAYKNLSIKGIGAINPSSAGNTGNVSIYLNGGGLTAGTKFFLRKAGQADIYGDSIRFVKNGLIMSIFNFKDKELGLYDVIVQVPGETNWIMQDGFIIMEGKAAVPWVNIVGRENILFNTWQTYTINYGNNGNVDALGVPLWIAIPDENASEIRFDDITVELSKYSIDKGMQISIDTIPLFFRTDKVFGETFHAKVYPLYIPVVPPGITFSASISIKASQNTTIMAWVNPPYFNSAFKGELVNCVVDVLKQGYVNITSGTAPIAECINSVGSLAYNPMDSYHPEQDNLWKSWIWNTAVTFADCGVNLTEVGSVVRGIGNFAINMSQYPVSIDSCKGAFKDLSRNKKDIVAVGSRDPNEKIGATGFTTAKYTNVASSFPYTIYFENKNTATAPAHKVYVYDTLDMSKFDLKNFAFGTISFGDHSITPLPGMKEFSADVDLRPEKELITRINAVLDTAKGIVRWEFLSLNPAKMALTDSIELGFLPPNIVSPEGEGSVSYTLGLKKDIKNNDALKNKAYIFFDANEAIVTNEYVNTIDTKKPSSAIIALPPVISDSVFTVSWSGIDDESGIRDYSVFVIVNDTDTIEWKLNTTETSAIFNGRNNYNYKFYVIATDKVGNVQDKSATFDTQTSVITGLNNINNTIKDYFSISPNPLKNKAVVSYFIKQTSDVTFIIYNIFGTKVFELPKTYKVPGLYNFSFNSTNFSSGLYFMEFKTESNSIIKKVIINN